MTGWIAEECARRKLDDFDSQHVANCLWAMGIVGILHERFLSFVIDSLEAGHIDAKDARDVA